MVTKKSISSICLLLFALQANSSEPYLDSKDRCSVYGEIDYLIWFANQDGLSYTTVANATTVSNNLFLSEKDRFIDPGWNSGVRALVGIQPTGVKWDTNLSYVYYSVNEKKKAHADSSSIPSSNAGYFSQGNLMLSDSSFELFELFPGPINYKTHGKWELFFNRIDFEFGRKIEVGSDFAVRPFFGLQGLGINQKVNEKTTAIYLSMDNGLPVTDVVPSKNKGQFYGIGSKGGFMGIFHLGKGFAFYGSAAGSILWGHFHIKQNYSQTDYYATGDVIEVGKESIDHSHNASILSGDLTIGFDWKYSFENSCHTIGLKIGWEEHFYTNMNRFQNFYIQEIDTANAVYAFDRNLQKGNLTLSGFTLGLIFNY